MFQRLLPILVLFLATTASAQIHVGIGAAVGGQPYENPEDDPRSLLSADLLLRGNSFGAHLAVDYADLSVGGILTATHANLIYRRRLGSDWAILLGAGPTWVDTEDFGTDDTWNAELELSRTIGRVELLGRVRQYVFEYAIVRNIVGSSGPAGYVGVRYNIR